MASARSSLLSAVFDDHRARLGPKLALLYVVLFGFNVLAWQWALMAFGDNAVLLGTALIAYGFGLRHAVDADHIAAIDNVTRKLMQEGKRPIGVGFFFALGHSTVVIVAATVVALTASTLQQSFPRLLEVGGVIGTSVSALFLFAIAAINVVVLTAVYRLLRRVRRGGSADDAELNAFLAQRGLLGRVFRRVFRLVSRSWHMYPLGFLFGLGFDTATEIALLGVAASEAVHGLSLSSVLVFPVLFTAGMSLVDTTDGALMLGAYGWAFVNPLRKLYYNLTITAVSVVVAIVIGGIETLGLLSDKLSLDGGFWLWRAVDAASDNFGLFGYVIVAVFAASWLVSYAIYRVMGGKMPATSGANPTPR
ncbi:MAG TPA: HoxN/HupN/NixA family nickel/cobalt transporter [Stellaceae bacterium]|nr:HoxN/HupN/NixA family nickel/cobalt transporter [Stellaceae bacterium]